MSNRASILMINMAKGFGGGEFQTEQLMLELVTNYDIYFLGKRSGKLIQKVKEEMPQLHTVTIWQAIKLVLTKKNLIIHSQDGRGAHIAHFLKKISKKPTVVTRLVSASFRRKFSSSSYKSADCIVGVSQLMSKNLQQLNPNCETIYCCTRPTLPENSEFERQYFSDKKTLTIAQIANLQPVKNVTLTIELEKLFPQITFYIVGSGTAEQENKLKEQAQNNPNIIFIPFTPYVGSILKNIDLHLMPSHLEGLPTVILEGYQYHLPTLAHATGGIPEIIENEKTGYLVYDNKVESYQAILEQLLNSPERLVELRENIKQYLTEKDFSAKRMAMEYHNIYQKLLKQA
ncbi:glycosyltransferase family 4 protein [Pasteurella skyensis]|uniref:glycosyltransferase family 4 protein n=1 Tax=Phocoenobacter skyensis TaxID=97481 RepID=UPI00275D51DB|nr:glycosyltransferase family 4 protein [Pasteurella skyensis]MDP8176085.1 glycosyltransferase family 4 protein [Pasteurella skyensis]MDP8198684.1 glycosyltransferase family 4 protein [Pasteurella skyensis]